MPEAPESKYLALKLKKLVLGKNFTKIISNTKTKRNLPNISKIIDINSKGKIIYIQTKDYYVHMHMGLTGWLIENKPRIYKYVLQFGRKKIYLQDQRRFSKIDIYDKDDHEKELDKIGDCVFCKNFTLESFSNKIKKFKRNISSLLLDQNIFAGIGNYIRNEALYIARISPKRNSKDLNDNEIKKLYHAIKFVIYSNLFDWLKDEIKIPPNLKKLAPKKLSIPYRMRVYARDKDNYGRKITFVKNMNGRKTFYVKSIQK